MKRRFVITGAVAVAVAIGSSRAAQRRPAPSGPIVQPSDLRVMLMAAESTYRRGEYDSARIAWTNLLTKPVVEADAATIAEIKTWLAFAEWRLSNYKTARAHGETALAIDERLGIASELPRTYNVLGLVAWNQGRLDDALMNFSKGLESAHRENDVLNAGKLAGNLGLVHVDLAQFDSARAGFETMLRVAEQLDDDRMAGNALNNLAMLDIQVGDARTAIPRLQRARSLYRKADYATGEQNALGQLATAYADQGQLQTAFALLDSANAVAMRKGLKQDVASNLELLGNLYRDAGESRKALDYYSRSQAMNADLGLGLEQGTVLRKIAYLEDKLGISDNAIASARKAAAVHQKASARFEEVKDRAFIVSRTTSRADAERLHNLGREIGGPVVERTVALADAHAAINALDYVKVLHVLDTHKSVLEGADYSTQAEVAELRAQALAAGGKLTEAIVAAKRSVDALERVRASIGSNLLRASFAAERAGSYARLVDYQLRARDHRGAFATVGLARARDHGRITASQDAAAQAAHATLAKITSLIDGVEELATDADGTLKMQRLNEELDKNKTEYEALIARSAWSRSAAGSNYDASAVQAALRPDEALIQYYISDEARFVFVLKHNAISGRRLPESARDLLAKVRIARGNLENAQEGRTAHSLHDALIRPVESELEGVRRLIIVPHAALAYLPFAALRDQHGRYLLEQYVIEYLPSAGDLAQLRGRPALPRPVVTVFQPFPRELPASTAEANSVRRAWSATIYRSKRATGSAFRSALGTDAIVHVTSHAAMDRASPMFSSVSLSDGSIAVHDIFAARVRAPLVFLSGCETGLGSAAITSYETGDDVSTFTRAFLSAGARAVVATLWRVEDESAGQMAASFYKYLKTTDAATALALAQRELLRSKRYGAPFYWAAYLVNGEVSFVGKS